MQELKQSLEEVKNLYQKVYGRAAPELGAETYFPFPAGVDPFRHTLLEVQHLKKLSEQATFEPRPSSWIPAADSFLTKDEFIVHLELPGIPREDLKVFVTGKECLVRGERKPPGICRFGAEHETDAMRPLATERPWGPFERRFVVPSGCHLDQMKARAADGVLELRVPMEVTRLPKEQKVEVSWGEKEVTR